MRLRLQPALLVAALPLTLALGACSSDDGESPPRARASVAPHEQPAVSGPIDGSARLTGAGAKLRYGGTAVIRYEAPSPQRVKTKLEVELTDVERGSLEDFEGFELGDDVRGTTPYYVRAQFINRGPKEISPSDLGSHLQLIDDAGEPESRVTTTLGNFPGVCRVQLPPHGFRPGQTFADCRIFLVPKGSSPAGVTFPRVLEYKPPVSDETVTWTPRHQGR